jgi:hypothetical protein
MSVLAEIIAGVKEDIMGSDIDIEEHVEIEFDSYDKKITLDIDDRRIRDAFMEEIDDEMMDDEFVMDTVAKVLIEC